MKGEEGVGEPGPKIIRLPAGTEILPINRMIEPWKEVSASVLGLGAMNRSERARERREQAIALSQSGLPSVQIAEALGVSRRMVSWYLNDESREKMLARGRERMRTLSPEQRAAHKEWQRAYVQRPEVRQRENERKRRWECAHAGRCADCHRPLTDTRVQRCEKCAREQKREAARKRTAKWLVLRRSGMGNWEIAEREGIPVYTVAVTLSRSRVARFPDLEWVRAPYKYRKHYVSR